MNLSTRRRFLGQIGALSLAGAASAQEQGRQQAPKRVAAVVTHYTHNSHADVIVSRLLQGYNLDFQAPRPALQLVSLYTDQVPADDMSRKLSREYGFPIYPTIAETLTLGGSELAVDGVLLIGEHGDYPLSDTGQIMYPRRRFFEETTDVFRRTGKSVPVFSDKFLSWKWEDARWMVDTAHTLKFPFMAGSSIPGTWRHPALEMKLGTHVKEAVELSFGALEAYGYHGLEAMQSIVERRHGGETGVKAVQFVAGSAVWEAAAQGRFSMDVFEAAAKARTAKGRFTGDLKDALKPAAFFVEYRDGFKAVLIHDTGSANSEWVTAWSEEGRKEPLATAHYTQEARPFGHFAFLLQGVERMIYSGKPTWPVERTLLVTGVLDAAFQSRRQGGARIETPHLGIRYKPTSSWKEPPAPVPNRPIDGQ
jgi:hypothetical protein